MKLKIHSSQNKKSSTCLFHFTEKEELRMKRAIKESKLFMQTYGKGREPYLIDKTYYN